VKENFELSTGKYIPAKMVNEPVHEIFFIKKKKNISQLLQEPNKEQENSNQVPHCVFPSLC
jgi:hypothetical protein